MSNYSITKEPAGSGGQDGGGRQTVITLRPGGSGSLKEITVIGPARGGQPREITLIASDKNSTFHRPTQVYAHNDVGSSNGLRGLQGLRSHGPDSAVLLNSKKIPRPPNAFMIFANEWRKRLAQQHPADSNKTISVRLGQLWTNMSKSSKEIYYQRSKQAGQDHKQKYPGYVYNPKEARMRKALREQSRGTHRGSALSRPLIPRGPVQMIWTEDRNQIMNHHRQSLVSPVMLPPHQVCPEDSKSLLQGCVDMDMHNYPDYMDLPYIPPTNHNTHDTQSQWYPYLQPEEQQSNGPTLNKMPVDWSTAYSSEQGNFIHGSPQSSPYSMQSHQEVPALMMNGDHHSPETLGDHKPCIDINMVKDPEQEVKELLASAKIISEGSPMSNGSTKQEDANSTRLPGFHQAFGSTEIGRFSQPDGFFEAAVAAENERKNSPESLSFSAWASAYSFPCGRPGPEPDLFGFQEPCHYLEPNHLYTVDYDSSIDPLDIVVKREFDDLEPQDLSSVASYGMPPVIISENDNCCVVLESSAIDTNNMKEYKEYFSL